MNWQVATFGLLLALLAGGFWWYERSRPPARLVALVAALSALAIAGRLVFAPLPNVVATTDIALITGYALGGAPGFAVGALAAPVSNIWLGQGPWTVWQMAGWGAAGLLGALLAFVSRRRLNRLGLATACGAAGLLYGFLLDFSLLVTYGGEVSVDRYLAISARSLPFNLAHAVGNFTIALAAGPALVALISRYRVRLEFNWRPAATIPVALAVLTPFGAVSAGSPPRAEAMRDATPARAQANNDRAVARMEANKAATRARAEAKNGATLAWLVRSQNSDGGFAAGRGQPSNPAMTGWVMLGLEAAGKNPLDVRRRGRSPVAYLRDHVGRLRSAGDLERSILALVGAGLDPHKFAGVNLVKRLRDKRDADGAIDGQVNLTAFFVLAVRAAGAEPGNVKRAARWLRRAQARNGGWGFQPEAPSDPDSTGAAVQALVAAGSEGEATEAGVRYLRRAQRGGGGFALSTSGVINSQSTAWAAQGLVAAGTLGEPLDRALDYLRSRRAADGHIRYSASSDQTPVWVTAQALLALHRQPFPIPRVAREPKPEPESGSPGAGAATTPPGAGTVTTPPPTAPTSPLTPPPPIGPVITPEIGGSGGSATTPSQKPSGAGEGRPVVPGLEGIPGLGGSAGGADGGGAPLPTSPEGAAVGDGEPGASTTGEASGPAAAAAAADEAPVAPYVISGMTGLAAILALGFLWFRERLP